MAPVVFVPGGLYEDMDAERFWARPGVTAALAALGWSPHLVGRHPRPASWDQEAAHLATAVKRLDLPVAVVAGSNGCSAALRLALDNPGVVSALVLCWPATGGDPEVDALTERRLVANGVDPSSVRALLEGGIVRGVADAELATVGAPVGIVPSEPENATHRRHTVDALAARLPGARVLPGSPETPSPGFAATREAFIETLHAVLSANCARQ